MTQTRFRRLTDLFVDGTAIPVGDGTYLWLQALNAFERDEAAHDAQMARARLAMALREDGDERRKIEARLEVVGREQFIENLASAKADAQFPTLSARLEDDPEWREKIEIIRRTDFASNASTTEQERQLVTNLMAEWSAELERRIDDEIEFQKRRYADAGDDDLLHDYLEVYMDRRGDDVAAAEYSLTETWYAARYCEATAGQGEGDVLDHAACNGHTERVFATKADVKAAPDRLRALIQEGLQTLAMNMRDPKDSGSQQSSSVSPPTPNEEAE